MAGVTAAGHAQPERVGRARRTALVAAVSEYLLVAASVTAATALVTWPHARVFSSHVISQIDPPFSMWRLAWFAHAIADGAPLLHANIFFPERYTYLLSDATLLQGIAAAPAIWLGAALPAVYNALLLFGIVSSGVALYWLARLLGVARAAAALAALIFSLAPYRIEHLGHLELQWIAPSIVGFGCLYQLLVAPRWAAGLGLALMVWLQFLASVYYAVFLLPLLAVLTLVSVRRLQDPRTLRILAVASLLCAALTLPVAKIYIDQGGRVGPRPMSDIARYSATPASYVDVPPENALYGSLASGLESWELRLFPGALAVMLALWGLRSPRRRVVAAATLVVIVSADLSMGVHGFIYPWLLESTRFLHGLRAPARFAVFVLAGIALLASLGLEEALTWARRRRISPALVTALAVAIVCVEYRSPQTRLSRFDMDPPVYRFLRSLPAGVVLELPVPRESGQAALDVDYTFWSTRHWRPLLNGYSGYYPASYQRTLDVVNRLPDPGSLALLRERGVRHLLVHTAYLDTERDRNRLMQLLAEPTLRRLGSYHDWIGPTEVFEVLR